MLGKLTIMTKPVIPDDDPSALVNAVRYLRMGTSRKKIEEKTFQLFNARFGLYSKRMDDVVKCYE